VFVFSDWTHFDKLLLVYNYDLSKLSAILFYCVTVDVGTGETVCVVLSCSIIICIWGIYFCLDHFLHVMFIKLQFGSVGKRNGADFVAYEVNRGHVVIISVFGSPTYTAIHLTIL